jgi:hypothetical protein
MSDKPTGGPAMDLQIYNDTIHCKTASVLSGHHSEYMPISAPEFSNIPILREFLADNDIQEITIASSCIGFVKTFTKSYRREG